MTNEQNEFPSGMASKMLNMMESLENLEGVLDPLISKPYKETMANLPPFDKSKIGMLEAYAINTLFWVSMQSSKELVEENLISNYKEEMERLKQAKTRMRTHEVLRQREQTGTTNQVVDRIVRRYIEPNEKRRQGQEGENSEATTGSKRSRVD